MTYSIIFASSAERQLREFEKRIQERILSGLERIRVRPYEFVKKLSGTSLYRLRVGDYRVIIDIQSQHILILVIKVGHRRHIYK